MEKKSLEQLIRDVYPNVNIVQMKKLAIMKLNMSRTGAISWQKFKNVDMVETEHTYYFDPRESLIRGQKKFLIIWAVLLVCSLMFIISSIVPELVIISYPLMIVSLLGCIACSINMLFYRKPSRIIMIWKNRIQENKVEKDERILKGVLLRGDGFSIVADMKEVSAPGTIGYQANFTVRFPL